jgi:Xaa-Pro aminopeptidase
MTLIDTTARLSSLRALMQANKIGAYLIPSEDAHQSEYIAPCDGRRAYISNFTGSAGFALVAEKEALLWTDGRYFLQAGKELDANWTLMKVLTR